MPTGTVYMPTLETERIRLRKMTGNDAADLFAYANDPEVARYTTWEAHKALEDSAEFIDFVLRRYEKEEPADWAITGKEQNKLIGTCGFVYVNAVHSRAEVGYALSREFWGKGIMTEVVREVIRYGFEELGLNRIEARADVRNIGSWRVMEKVNMQFEGVLRQHLFAKGEYHDLKMYSLLAEEYRKG